MLRLNFTIAGLEFGMLRSGFTVLRRIIQGSGRKV